MKNKLCFLLVLLFVTSSSYAKKDGNTVSGRVLGKDSKPVASANVVLLEDNNALVKADLTNEQGSFSIEGIAAGEYKIKVMLLGFDTYSSAPFTLEGNLTLPDITLKEKGVQLNEVAVRGQKPLIEVQADKLIVNVENSIVSAGSSALEVLQRAPNVTVDQNDNISLKGRQGVTIMMNGKLIPMRGNDLANMLKGMPSSAIDKIELISNPGARYDAAGTGGIINIIMKKDNRMGANGSVTAGYTQGIYPKENFGLSLNYRNKKWTVYSNYNHSYRKGMNELILLRKFYTAGVYDTAYAQHNYAIIHFKNHGGNIGVDYALSPKTTVGMLLTGGYNSYTFDGNNHSDVLDKDFKKIWYFNTATTNDNQYINYGTNLNLRHKFDSTGKELSLDADYIQFNTTTSQDIYTQYVWADETVMKDPYRLLGLMDGHTNIKSVKADYTHPLRNKLKLEAGLKTSFVTADNEPTFYNTSTGTQVYDSNRSNHFIYKENINAAYVNTSKDWEKWSVQLGLRVEQTIVEGDEKLTNATFKKQYAQLFPSVVLLSHLNPKNDLSVSLSRRIERPSYRQLNPFKDYIDLSSIHQALTLILPLVIPSS
jgi:hypothetical protein